MFCAINFLIFRIYFGNILNVTIILLSPRKICTLLQRWVINKPTDRSRLVKFKTRKNMKRIKNIVKKRSKSSQPGDDRSTGGGGISQGDSVSLGQASMSSSVATSSVLHFQKSQRSPSRSSSSLQLPETPQPNLKYTIGKWKPSHSFSLHFKFDEFLSFKQSRDHLDFHAWILTDHTGEHYIDKIHSYTYFSDTTKCKDKSLTKLHIAGKINFDFTIKKNICNILISRFFSPSYKRRRWKSQEICEKRAGRWKSTGPTETIQIFIE